MPPRQLTYTCIGAGLLWVGWFGFNAGSAVAAGDSAANAFLSTHLASSMGLIAWACIEWITPRQTDRSRHLLGSRGRSGLHYARMWFRLTLVGDRDWTGGGTGLLPDLHQPQKQI